MSDNLGHVVGLDSGIAGRRAEMAAFDGLPKELRDHINYAPRKFLAVSAATRCKQAGATETMRGIDEILGRAIADDERKLGAIIAEAAGTFRPRTGTNSPALQFLLSAVPKMDPPRPAPAPKRAKKKRGIKKLIAGIFA